MRMRCPDLWANLPGRLAGLTGDLTAQLAADLAAVDHERRPSRAPDPVRAAATRRLVAQRHAGPAYGEPMSDLTQELARYAPPDIPLRLTATGSGSRPDIVEYVRTVIEQRTTVNDDTTADRLARALVTSILSRLGAGYSIATGSATIALVPAEVELRQDA